MQLQIEENLSSPAPEAHRNQLAPPPNSFRPAGEVRCVEHSRVPPAFIQNKVEVKRRGRQADGVRYEKRGQEWLRRTRSSTYIASPWFHFSTAGFQDRWCQLDGLDLNVNEGVATIVEFKLSHCSRAWWQTRRLYEPVVQAWLGSAWKCAIVEVVRWLDPHTAFPEHFRVIPSFAEVQPRAFHVLVWSG